MIGRYFKSLSTGDTPPTPVSYNPVCLTKGTENPGLSAFYRVNATYSVSQSTVVTVVVITSYNSNTETKTYTITRTIPNGASVSENAKLGYTTGYSDEHFVGVSSMAFSPAVDGGGKTFSNNGICG